MTFFTRDVYITGRKAQLAHSEPKHGIEIYYYQSRNGKPCMIAFCGRAQKPSYEYAYKSEEQREEHAVKILTHETRRREESKKARAEKLHYQHTLKEGNLLRVQWGYEQTNNEFYQVIAVKGKSVIVREIAQKKEYSYSMAGTTHPIRNHFIGEPELKRVTTGNVIRFSSYRYAFPFKDGDNTYFSEYA